MTVLLAILLFSCSLHAQKRETNYDEAKVPAYELPDPLQFDDGREVRNARQWEKKRRPQVLEVFAQEMYGHMPARPEGLHFSTISEETVYAGLGLRKMVRIYLDADQTHWFDVLIHLPKDAAGPVPMFVGLNFKGNDATLDERADFRWPYELVLKAGMGVATAWRESIEPDGKDSKLAEAEGVCRDGGVRSWYNKDGDWGAISAWAWGLSRIVDYLETDEAYDTDRLAVIGHSRLGKTALWAGANDLRFDMVISNDSGCCGAALLRGKHGENMASINALMPYWFAPAFGKFTGREQELPFDQHTVLALVAPRLLHVASGSTDFWADPPGEHRSTVLAGEIYRLYGSPEMDDTFPAENTPVEAGAVGYHLRQGPHLLTEYDWICLLDHVTHVLN